MTGQQSFTGTASWVANILVDDTQVRGIGLADAMPAVTTWKHSASLPALTRSIRLVQRQLVVTITDPEIAAQMLHA